MPKSYFHHKKQHDIMTKWFLLLSLFLAPLLTAFADDNGGSNSNDQPPILTGGLTTGIPKSIVEYEIICFTSGDMLFFEFEDRVDVPIHVTVEDRFGNSVEGEINYSGDFITLPFAADALFITAVSPTGAYYTGYVSLQ